MKELVVTALEKIKPLIAIFVVENVNNHVGQFTIRPEFAIQAAGLIAQEPDRNKELIKIVVGAVNDFIRDLNLPSETDANKAEQERRCQIDFDLFETALKNFNLNEPCIPKTWILGSPISTTLQVELNKLLPGLQTAKRGLEAANAQALQKLSAETKKIKAEMDSAAATFKAELEKKDAEIRRLTRTRVPSTANPTPASSPPKNDQTLFAQKKAAAPKRNLPKNDAEYLKEYFGDHQLKVLGLLYRLTLDPQNAEIAKKAYLERVLNYDKPLPQDFMGRFNIQNEKENQTFTELSRLVAEDSAAFHQEEMKRIYARHSEKIKGNTLFTDKYIILDRYKKFLVRPNTHCRWQPEFVPQLIPNIYDLINDEMVKSVNMDHVAALAKQEKVPNDQILINVRDNIRNDDQQIFGETIKNRPAFTT